MSYGVNKNLYNRDESMESIIAGMKKVYDKVSITTGGLGKWVIIENHNGLPKIINDGVGITKDIWLENKLENLGAQLIVSSADNTAKVVGDNTSMTTILTYKLSELGWKELKNNPDFRAIYFVNGMKYQADVVLAKLEEHIKPIQSGQDLFDVAHIASRDEKVSNLIVQALAKVTEDGVIHIIKSQKDEDYLEIIEGMRLDVGISSPQLFLDKANNVSQLNNPHVVLVNDTINKPGFLTQLYNKVIKDENSSNDILIVANEFTGEVISNAIANNKKTKLNIQLVMTPGVSDSDKLDYLMDIQTITGGDIFEVFGGNKIEYAEVKTLGVIEKAIINNRETSLFTEKDQDIEKRIEDRVKYLRSILDDKENTTSKLKMASLAERIARLTSGVALIRIYEPTEEALEDKWERTEDALKSVKSALKGGLLPGGAISFKDVFNELGNNFYADKDQFPLEFNIGRQVVMDALLAPFKQILINAEFDEKEIKQIQALPVGDGINVFSGETGNMIEKGVIDTYLGARISIINSISTSTMLLRTGGAITRKDKN